jgi:hypothetical protein
MGLRGPKPLSGKELEMHGSPRAESRLKQEQEKRKLLTILLGQTFAETFSPKENPQERVADAVDYFVQLSAEEFIRAIVIILRRELDELFETKVSLTKIIKLLEKDRAEIGRLNSKHI